MGVVAAAAAVVVGPVAVFAAAVVPQSSRMRSGHGVCRVSSWAMALLTYGDPPGRVRNPPTKLNLTPINGYGGGEVDTRPTPGHVINTTN